MRRTMAHEARPLLAVALACAWWAQSCSDQRHEFDSTSGTANGGTAAASGSTQGGDSTGQSEGGEPASAGGSAGEAVQPGSGGEPAVGCTQAALVDSVSGTTVDGGDDFSTSCGAGTSADAAYHFVAPATGYYSFDSSGSAFDAVVALLTGCDDSELACDSGVGQAPHSEVVAQLNAGEKVVVVLDGNLGDQGQYTLNASPVTCPGLDLTGQPVPANLSTAGQPDEHQPVCGDMAPAANSPERTLRWVPEEDGLYRFSVTTSAFRPTLSVFEGAKCGGALLQCSYNVPNGYPPEVTRWLAAGQVVTLIVDSLDGGSGAFSLDVKSLSSQCSARPAVTQALLGVSLDDGNGTNILSPSCSWAGNQYQNVNQPFEEHIYPVVIPASGFSSCSYRFENLNGDWVAYLLSGDNCGGRELDCQTGAETEVSFDFTPDDAGDYLLVIENQAPFPGLALSYDLTMECF